MISLHRVSPTMPWVLFFGPLFRCEDRYHDGYTEERTDTSSHSQCAWRMFDRMELEPPYNRTDGTAYICDCNRGECNGTNVHYYVVPENEMVLDADGRYRCMSCRNNQHPAPVARPNESRIPSRRRNQ